MTKFRTLLVEDSPTQLTFMKKFLQASSFDVVATATNGDKALESLGITGEKSPVAVDLIISDYEMPVRDGYQLLLAVKKSHLSKFPFVMISCEGTEDRKQKCIAGGAWKFLNKPVSVKDLSELYGAMMADGVMKSDGGGKSDA